MAEAQVRFLGTGTAFQQDGRGAQCVRIEPARSTPFLVDLGPTGLAAMSREGVDPGAIDRLFVTHLHGDHTAGWPFFLLHEVFLGRRERPLGVWGPPGVRERLDGLTRLCFGEILAAHARFRVDWHEVAVARAADLDGGPGLCFDVEPMDHDPSSIGYRFRFEDRAVAISGDTRWCAGLERLAEGTDVLVVECTSRDPVDHAHLSLAEIRSRIERLPAGDVVLVHLVDEVAAALAIDPIPRVVAAYDGMLLPLR